MAINPQMGDVVPFATLDLAAKRAAGEVAAAEGLKRSGGGGTSGGMDDRVTRLEVHMETVQRDLVDIKTDLRSTLEIVRGLPTRNELTTFRWQWVATAVAAIALIVGGIIGGLGWIKPDAPAPAVAAAPAPIVIQVPTPASPTRR